MMLCVCGLVHSPRRDATRATTSSANGCISNSARRLFGLVGSYALYGRLSPSVRLCNAAVVLTDQALLDVVEPTCAMACSDQPMHKSVFIFFHVCIFFQITDPAMMESLLCLD